MSNKASTSIGSCLCKTVSLETNADLNKYHICHCGICRRWNGGPNFAIELKGNVILKGEDALVVYNSSEFAERGFCKHCGTHMFYRLKEPNTYFVPVGIFGDEAQPILESEIFIDNKPDYYNFESNCPKLTEKQVFEMYASDE